MSPPASFQRHARLNRQKRSNRNSGSKERKRIIALHGSQRWGRSKSTRRAHSGHQEVYSKNQDHAHGRRPKCSCRSPPHAHHITQTIMYANDTASSLDTCPPKTPQLQYRKYLPVSPPLEMAGTCQSRVLQSALSS